MKRNFRTGDVVVFAMQKRGTSPGPRARNVHTSEKGDDYSYLVDKFWRVASVTESGLCLKTRRGKTHVVPANDVRLRRPSLWETIFMRSKFPAIDDSAPTEKDGDAYQSVGAPS